VVISTETDYTDRVPLSLSISRLLAQMEKAS